MRSIFTLVLALAILAPPARAAWLRADFHAVTIPFLTFQGPEPFDDIGIAGESYAVDGWMVFDTDARPQTQGGQTVFPVGDFRLSLRRYDGAGADPIVLDPSNADAHVVVLGASGGVRFRAESADTSFSFDVPWTAAPVAPGGSLPDAPGGYAVSGGASDSVVCSVVPPSGTPTDAAWSRAGGHDLHTLVRYHVRETEAPDPEPEPCSPADIDADGDTDPDDIAMFVDLFILGCG